MIRLFRYHFSNNVRRNLRMRRTLLFVIAIYPTWVYTNR